LYKLLSPELWFCEFAFKKRQKATVFSRIFAENRKEHRIFGIFRGFFQIFRPAVCEKIFEKFSNIPFKRLTIY
jgi:hypothetical protein